MGTSMVHSTAAEGRGTCCCDACWNGARAEKRMTASAVRALAVLHAARLCTTSASALLCRPDNTHAINGPAVRQLWRHCAEMPASGVRTPACAASCLAGWRLIQEQVAWADLAAAQGLPKDRRGCAAKGG